MKNYGNKEQLIDILNSMKFPIMGAGGGFAPIGTRGYFEGQTAPQGWLICDGSTKNIADYPDLATYIASQHGSVNYYGGDGTTTFGLPTMSGMPNSGIDTPNEHIVGERREIIDGVLKKKPLYEKEIDFGQMPSGRHADETLYTFSSDIDFVVLKDAYGTSRCDSLPSVYASDAAYSINVAIKKVDNLYRLRIDTGTSVNGTIFGHVMGIVQYTKTIDTWQAVQEGHSSDGNGVFCVKATVSGDPNAHVYSTDEQVVGTWIDGKDECERVIELDSVQTISPNNWYTTGVDASDVAFVISCFAINTINGNCFPCIGARDSDGHYFGVNNLRSGGNMAVNCFVFRYVKTS